MHARLAAFAVLLLTATLAGGRATAQPFTGVADANPKTPGIAEPNVLTRELAETVVAQGSFRLENPATVDLGGGRTAGITYYGYWNDGPQLPLPAAPTVEASKTEPDKNTYLVLRGQRGADPAYDYGTHFVYQGHETGVAGRGYLTRINLDADGEHRVTLLAFQDVAGAPLPTFDGSTWDPFAHKLLLSFEGGSSGGIWQASLDFPAAVESLFGSFGRGGYEGIQTDDRGNVWVVEDVGGATGAVNNRARQPNSFIYRFVPARAGDLTAGRLEVLQVLSLRSGQAITFHPGQADADILSDDIKDLHTYGLTFKTRWVTLHDTAVDGTASFDANALAKARGGTPFKRPENGQFRPGSGFREFFFDATGDTDIRTQAGSTFGGFGALFKLTQASPSASEGRLSLFFRGDVVHSGFDNVAFWDEQHVVFVEDAGDTLHAQRNALDSAYLFDVRVDYSDPAHQPVRILAQGRDPSATIDSALGGSPAFQNEGDNEITGFHVSNGDPGPEGLLGASGPRPFRDGWRVFYTQQHGDNVTWEIIPAAGHGSAGARP
jgi:hypothetical protein